MNIEIANRLVRLRKEKNLSQEALANELGISRQAVSKWERAEASPDTDNLILLAKLYGMSLDDLLKTRNHYPHAPRQKPMYFRHSPIDPEPTTSSNTEPAPNARSHRLRE